ncbi:MAG: hypothetical protein ACR2F2_11020 [Pyrinomonadaceae bacterium]
MKFSILFLLFFFVTIMSVNAQSSESPENPYQAEEMSRKLKQKEESNRRFEALKSVGEYSRNVKNRTRTGAIQVINNIYRKPTKDESKTLTADKEDLKKYAQFMRQSDAGLTKLIIDRGCADYTSVLNVSADCLKYTMPGAGSSFSFRTGNYRVRRLSDLTYREDGFYSAGVLAHGIIVNIGDIPLEQVTTQTNGLKFLIDFETASEYKKAEEIDGQIDDGIESNGFFYCRSAKTDDDATYILRSIAYRGSYYRAMQGFVYDELDFDERRDVLVAFRIVRRDNEGVTILWKTLENQKSPAIKKPSREELKREEDKFTAETGSKDKN